MELVREHTVHIFDWCWSEQAVCAVHVVSVPRCVIHSPLRAPTRKYAHTNRIAWAQHGMLAVARDGGVYCRYGSDTKCNTYPRIVYRPAPEPSGARSRKRRDRRRES